MGTRLPFGCQCVAARPHFLVAASGEGFSASGDGFAASGEGFAVSGEGFAASDGGFAASDGGFAPSGEGFGAKTGSLMERSSDADEISGRGLGSASIQRLISGSNPSVPSSPRPERARREVGGGWREQAE